MEVPGMIVAHGWQLRPSHLHLYSQGEDMGWPWPFVMGCVLPYAVFDADLESVAQIFCGLLYSELQLLLLA
ncbi:hypothetical protein Y032_0111g263 [Ancylostoma ceylanicum]|uniref:Uncharacterized protein n=1 Tax=Ancylostoma ceylanicum TaxID=53326 RepID=A0A016TEJ5_9BILA|nr:hypothetical protein Y032_0111g263 [Ancylostoma ceylanicum]